MRGRSAARPALLPAPRPPGGDEDRETLFEWRRYVLNRLRAGEVPQMALQTKRRSITSDGDELAAKKRREQEQLLALSTEKLYREMMRLEALKRIREGSTFVTNFSEGGAPMKVAFEFFAQFRYGIAGLASVPPSLMMTTATKQVEFVDSMIEPGAECYGLPAATAIIGGFTFKNQVHPSFRLERTATEIIADEETVTVVCKVNNYLWYSLGSVKALHPHVLGNEKIMKKLVGQMLRVPLTMRLFFNSRGRLINLTCDTDLLSGLMDVLGDMDECLEVLGDDGGADKLQREPEEELSASECSDNGDSPSDQQPAAEGKGSEDNRQDQVSHDEANEETDSKRTSELDASNIEEHKDDPPSCSSQGNEENDGDGQPSTTSR